MNFKLTSTVSWENSKRYETNLNYYLVDSLFLGNKISKDFKLVSFFHHYSNIVDIGKTETYVFNTIRDNQKFKLKFVDYLISDY